MRVGRMSLNSIRIGSSHFRNLHRSNSGRNPINQLFLCKSFATTTVPDDEEEHKKHRMIKPIGVSSDSTKGFIEKWLCKVGMSPEQITVKADYNRIKVIPASTINHLCLGSIFAWSIFNKPLMTLQGVIVPAASDWALSDVSIAFTLVMGGFAWGGLLSNQLERFGPRACCLIGAASLSSGLLCIGTGAYYESLPLIYAGGLIWGFANGWAYVPPVSTLIKWFPDRKGFASGMCLLGYGGGAIIAAPLFQKLLTFYQRAPEYLGSVQSMDLVTESGKYFAKVDESLREVVIATTADIQASNFANSGLQEGVYVVGTGSTGAFETMCILGIGYGAIMSLNCLNFKLPPVDYNPVHHTDSSSSSVQLTTFNVKPEIAMTTPQFWLLYTGFGLAATGSYGFISCGKLMLTECFATKLPAIVTTSFATSFVAGMSISNLSGRFIWSYISDMLAKYKGGDPFYGRKLTFNMLWMGMVPVYTTVIYALHESAAAPSELTLAAFTACVMFNLSGFGGMVGGRPPVVADLFGTKYVGNLTARQLTVVLPASFAGPQLVSYFRESAIAESIHNLAAMVDDERFFAVFGTGKSQINTLIQQKSISISRLMELVPAGTIDPTPFSYDQAFYTMIALQAVAIGTNLLLKPVNPKLYEKTG